MSSRLPRPDRGVVAFEVALCSTPLAQRALVREPSGRDELAAPAGGVVAVTDWLRNLLIEGPGRTLRREQMGDLFVGDRDRIVAALHSRCFGDRIEDTATCTSCREAFELSFSLSALVDSRAPRASAEGVEGPDEGGTYSLSDGRRFRLPRTEDERAVIDSPAAEAASLLARRCVLSGNAANAPEALERAFATLGPVLDLDLPMSCALCGAEQKVHFDVVSVFLASLTRERRALHWEIHRLAVAYGWSFREITALPRSVRRAHVALLVSERPRSRAS